MSLPILLILGMAAVWWAGFSFGKYWVVHELTRDWGHADWAIFRDTKRYMKRPNMSLSEYINQRVNDNTSSRSTSKHFARKLFIVKDDRRSL